MKLRYSENLKKSDCIELDLPDMREKYLIPNKIHIESNGKIEFCLNSNKTSILKYSESYFKSFQEVSLKDYHTKLSDGEKFQVTIRNQHREPQDIVVQIDYIPFTGNILFTQTNTPETIRTAPENFLSNYGQITRLMFTSDSLIKTIKITPIYSSDSKNWIEETVLEVGQKDYTLDLTRDYRKYARYFRYIRLDIDLETNTETKTNNDIYLIGYGFKN